MTLDGQPLSGVTVVFFDDQAAVQASANTGSDGSYSLQHAGGPRVPAGKYKIKVTPKEELPKPPAAGGTPAGSSEAKGIPDKYLKFETSGFTAEVKTGENSVDLAMKKT